MRKAVLSVAFVLALIICACAFAETSTDTIKEWIDEGVGEGETITDVSLDDRILAITVDLGEVEELYDGYIIDLATERASSITDTLLDHDDFDAEWDNILLMFTDVGYFDLNKNDIETNEYDLRFMNVYNDDYSSRITLTNF